MKSKRHKISILRPFVIFCITLFLSIVLSSSLFYQFRGTTENNRNYLNDYISIVPLPVMNKTNDQKTIVPNNKQIIKSSKQKNDAKSYFEPYLIICEIIILILLFKFLSSLVSGITDILFNNNSSR